MEGKVILGYWQIRGLAERIRMLLEYTGVAYEEEKYSGDNRQKWFDLKPELVKKNPAVTLPYLKDGDKLISESDAILVYVIHKSGKVELLGRDGEEQVKIATAYGVTRDLHGQYISLVYGRYGDKTFEEAKADSINNFKPYLQKLDSLLGDSQYFAGKITWIDFIIAEFLQALRLLSPELIGEYSKINSHIDRIWGLPAIKSYHESARFNERPVNNPGVAKWY